mgnify:CR=1 FL=1
MVSTSKSAARQALARKSFTQLPIPMLKYGLDISTNIAPFDFDAIAAQSASENVVSTNETLGNGVVFCDLSTAKTLFPFVEKNWSTLLSLENKFESFHVVNVKNTLVIVIPANTKLAAPLTIPSSANTFEHVFIWAQRNSSATLLHLEGASLENESASASSYRSVAVEIFADENAHVSYAGIQTFPLRVERFSFKRARVEQNASVEWYWAEFGSHLVKADVSSFLSGENASTKNIGVYFGNASQVFDFDASVHHLSSQTHSELLARGVLDDSSKNVYKGLIKMTKDAKGSVGNQRADVLVLSPLAEADPVPMLEIEGADIRCSHAATVSRLDAFKLFYLTSRGLDESAARSLYIHGFLGHLLSRFPTLHAIADYRVFVAEKLGVHPTGESLSLHLGGAMV